MVFIPNNLYEIKALIHFLNWVRGREKERKKVKQDVNLGRVEAGQGNSHCLTFNNLGLWFRVVIFSVSLHSSFPYGHLTVIQAKGPFRSWGILTS